MYLDLIEQTTTTVGTGSYSMVDTPDGRRPFSTYTAGDVGIPYVATDDATQFECGIGKWNAGVLERSTVLSSSNGGAAVNWAAGTKRIFVDAHAAVMLTPYRHNLLTPGTTAPGNAQDAAAGYGTGSLYRADIVPAGGGDAVRRLFYCHAASVGAAAWSEILLTQTMFTSLGATQYIAAGNSKLVGSGAVVLNGPYAWVCGVSTNGADDDLANGYYADAYAAVAQSVLTTDATPTKLGVGGDFATKGGLYVDGYAMYEGQITAFTLDRANRRAWKVLIAAMADGAGAVTIDVATFTDVHQTAGAAGWSIAAVDGGDWGLALEATGAAATSIAWSAALTAIAPGTP